MTVRAIQGFERWSSALRMQIRIIHALFMREAMRRYGHENLGFFWVVGEPLLFSCGVMVLWSVAKISHSGAVEAIPFALTGYSFITMWRHITSRATGALSQYSGLAYHRQVKQIDAFIALGLLETLSCFTAFAIAYLPLWLLGFCPTITDPLPLVAGFYVTGVFSLGFGLILAGLSQVNHVVAHVVPAFMYLTLPATGVFTMQEWMPEQIRDFLSWSPLVNGIEMFRSGLFSPDVPAHYSASYLMVTTVIALVVGYWIFVFGAKNV